MEIYQERKQQLKGPTDAIDEQIIEFEALGKERKEDIGKLERQGQIDKRDFGTFSKLVQEAIKYQTERDVEEIDDWTETEIQSRIKARREFKLKVKNTKMVEFIEKAPLMVNEANLLARDEAPNFYHQADEDYGTGYLSFEKYRHRRDEAEECYESNLIMVEGAIYQLLFYPNGFGDDDKSHISLGIVRTKSSCLNLDVDDKVTYSYTMLHPSGFKSKNITAERTSDWTGPARQSFVSKKFFSITNIERKGFINPDGSLQFQFKIKKQNYRKRAILAEAQIANSRMLNDNKNEDEVTESEIIKILAEDLN